MVRFASLTLFAVVTVALALVAIAGCKKAEEASPPVPPPTPSPTAAQEQSTPPAAKTTSESAEPEEAEESESGEAESVHEIMETTMKPQMGALAGAVATSDFETVAASANALRTASEGLASLKDAPADPRFAGFADDLVTAAADLADAAGKKDAELVQAGLESVKAACQACHDEFRKKG